MATPWTAGATGPVGLATLDSPQPRLSMPRRQKRVLVTSCDTCRLRKLRCNAKELPQGSSCSNCDKTGVACTFEDFKESIRPIIRMRPTKAINGQAQIHDPGLSLQPNVGSPLPPSMSWTPTSVHATSPAAAAAAGLVHRSELAHSGGYVRVAHPRTALPINPQPSGLGQQKRMFPAEPYLNQLETASSGKKRCLTGAGGVTHGDDNKPGPWNGWSLPALLTSPSSRKVRVYSPYKMVHSLLERFYAEPTLLSIIVPYEELFGRLDALVAQQCGVRTSSGVLPIPDFLLLAVIACAATSPASREPELRIWKEFGWKLAMGGVNARVQQGYVQLELVQALLLLGLCCPGEPEGPDRIVIFETAIKLSFQLKLGSSKALESPNLTKRERSKRIVLYWLVYAVDKLVAVSCGRPGLIVRDAWNMPSPTLHDMLIYGSSNLTSQAGSPKEAQDQIYWLHNLALCYLALSQILEDIQQKLYPLRDRDVSISLSGLYGLIKPSEDKLEEWCKTNRNLLQDASEQGRVGKRATAAIVSQLHLVQIQLYQLPLRFEFTLAQGPYRNNPSSNQPGVSGSTNVAACPSGPQQAVAGANVRSVQRIRFGPYNGKALTACIESAWHLLQQGDGSSGEAISPFSAAMVSTGTVPPAIAGLGATTFAVLKASQFIRFLSYSWEGWNHGLGMLQFTSADQQDQGRRKAAKQSLHDHGSRTVQAASGGAKRWTGGSAEAAGLDMLEVVNLASVDGPSVAPGAQPAATEVADFFLGRSGDANEPIRRVKTSTLPVNPSEGADPRQTGSGAQNHEPVQAQGSLAPPLMQGQSAVTSALGAPLQATAPDQNSVAPAAPSASPRGGPHLHDPELQTAEVSAKQGDVALAGPELQRTTAGRPSPGVVTASTAPPPAVVGPDKSQELRWSGGPGRSTTPSKLSSLSQTAPSAEFDASQDGVAFLKSIAGSPSMSFGRLEAIEASIPSMSMGQDKAVELGSNEELFRGNRLWSEEPELGSVSHLSDGSSSLSEYSPSTPASEKDEADGDGGRGKRTDKGTHGK